MLRARAGLLLVATVAALLVSVSASSAAAPRPAACRAGQAPVLAAAKHGGPRRRTCVTLAPATAAGADRSVQQARRLVPAAKVLRAAMPARLRSRFPAKDLTRLDAALRRALAPGARTSRAVGHVLARAAAPSCQDPSGGATPQTASQDGVTVTGTGGSWGRFDEPAHGKVSDVTASLADGSSKRDRNRTCVSWDSCPAADGTLPGHSEASWEQTTHAQSGGVALDIVAAIDVEADLVAHVGDDGRLTSFDWTAAATGDVHAALRSQGRTIRYRTDSKVRMTLRGTGADPRTGGTSATPPQLKAWGGRMSLLDGANAEVMNVARSVASFIYAVPGEVSRPLLGAEKVFYDQAACLDVVFAPADPEVQAGEQVPVGVTVRAKDGATVPATFTVTPTTGSVADRSGRTPGSIAYVAPDPLPAAGRFQTFELVAVSRRGRALGTHAARGRQGVTYWDVTFRGMGDYRRDEGPARDDEHHVTSTFSWTTSWKAIPVGDGHPAPQASTAGSITGTWQDVGRFGAPGPGDFTCGGALADEGDLAFAQVAGAAGGYRLQVAPFSAASSAGQDAACSGLPGAPYAGVFLSGDLPALTAQVAVDAGAEAGRPIPVAVQATRPLADGCADLPMPSLAPCTDAVHWTGVVTLTRVTGPGR